MKSQRNTLPEMQQRRLFFDSSFALIKMQQERGETLHGLH